MNESNRVQIEHAQKHAHKTIVDDHWQIIRVIRLLCHLTASTISRFKRASVIKGDIDEALQCIKCVIRHDLSFREPSPSSAVEAKSDDEDGRG